jgi:photosystem II stability/assembly factor-like uncharacterized protein
MASSPQHPTVLLAATQGHGVLRSQNGGESWQSVLPGVDNAWTVRFDPHQGGVAYAGTQTAGFWRSTDEGQTWSAQNQGLDLDVRSIDASGDLVVAGTARGVFASRDAGKSWQSLGLSGLDIAAVAILPRPSGFRIFAGADNGASNGYLLKADELRGSWSFVHGSLPSDATISALAVAPGPGGATPTMVAGTSDGLAKSDDGGSTWNLVSGLPQTDFNAVLYNPNSPEQLYAGSDGDQGQGGIFRSLDRGATWSPLGFGLPTRPRITALGIVSLSPLQVLCATWNPTAGSAALFRMPDASATGSNGNRPASTPAASARPTSPAASAAPAVGVRPAKAQSPLVRDLGLALGLLVLVAVLVIWRWRLRRADARGFRR